MITFYYQQRVRFKIYLVLYTRNMFKCVSGCVFKIRIRILFITLYLRFTQCIFHQHIHRTSNSIKISLCNFKQAYKYWFSSDVKHITNSLDCFFSFVLNHTSGLIQILNRNKFITRQPVDTKQTENFSDISWKQPSMDKNYASGLTSVSPSQKLFTLLQSTPF